MKPVLDKEKLLWMRLQQGWSQEQAAVRCGASDKKQYHLWETGKTRLPHAAQLAGIVHGFELDSVDDILLRPGEAPDPAMQIFYSAHFRQPLPVVADNDDEEMLPCKLACFSLDGVLLQGFQFSWSEVWSLLGDSGLAQQKKGLKLFHTGRMSYADWCLWCCNIFRSHGLQRSQLQALARRYRVVAHLYEGLQQLRDAGYRLALVSGSLGVFLDTLIPDHAEWFDQVFINQLQFDSSGHITGVVPTPFDMERKPDAVRYLCSLYDLHSAQSVCIGSSFVDKHMILAGGRTVAFNSASDEVRTLFDIAVDSDDFRELADVLVGLAAG